jgi:hypothetical protein
MAKHLSQINELEPTLEIKILTYEDILNNNDLVDGAIDCSKEVFQPSRESEIKYHNKEDWLRRIQNGGILVVAKMDGKTVGFTICDVRASESQKNLHIWLSGVLRSHQGKRIFSSIHKNILEYVKNYNSQQSNKDEKFANVTLNTGEDRFPSMYAFCKLNGYQIINTENTENGIKTFLQLPV